MYFDTHAHYDDKRFNEDRDSLLASLPAHGVEYVVNVGADLPSSLRSLKLAQHYGFIYAAVGVHPHETKQLNEENFSLLREYCSKPRVVALGEIGLDFHYDFSPRDTQRHWFKRQLELAAELSLPVIIHSREAAAETFEMIAASGVRRGVIHCYSGSAEMALKYVNMGFYIGIGGVITYNNAKKLKEAAEAIPLDKILLETDCPYLPPTPHRGERNDSRYLSYIAHQLAQIKNVPHDELAQITTQNALRCYALTA
jgi:TatD DNase family protein